MPKYSGLVDLAGRFGNYSFYKRKGVNCVRRAGGFSKERIENDPALHRVLEHTAEFGAQSMASRSLRTSLAPLKKYWDGTFHNRLMKIGAVVTSLADGKHGERPVAFSQVKDILRGLQLNASHTLESSFLTLIKSIPFPARNGVKLNLNFEVSTAVKPPKGATHFRLVHALGVTSDVEYEPAVAGFLPAAHEVDGIGAVSHSDYLSVEQQEPANITFETNLPTQHINENATVVEVLGIEFFQKVAKHHLPMVGGKAAMVVGAF